MSISERLEQLTLNLMTEELYIVEEAKPGYTDEQFDYLLNLQL